MNETEQRKTLDSIVEEEGVQLSSVTVIREHSGELVEELVKIPGNSEYNTELTNVLAFYSEDDVKVYNTEDSTYQLTKDPSTEGTQVTVHSTKEAVYKALGTQLNAELKDLVSTMERIGGLMPEDKKRYWDRVPLSFSATLAGTGKIGNEAKVKELIRVRILGYQTIEEVDKITRKDTATVSVQRKDLGKITSTFKERTELTPGGNINDLLIYSSDSVRAVDDNGTVRIFRTQIPEEFQDLSMIPVYSTRDEAIRDLPRRKIEEIIRRISADYEALSDNRRMYEGLHEQYADLSKSIRFSLDRVDREARGVTRHQVVAEKYFILMNRVIEEASRVEGLNYHALTRATDIIAKKVAPLIWMKDASSAMNEWNDEELKPYVTNIRFYVNAFLEPTPENVEELVEEARTLTQSNNPNGYVRLSRVFHQLNDIFTSIELQSCEPLTEIASEATKAVYRGEFKTEQTTPPAIGHYRGCPGFNATMNTGMTQEQYDTFRLVYAAANQLLR